MLNLYKGGLKFLEKQIEVMIQLFPFGFQTVIAFFVFSKLKVDIRLCLYIIIQGKLGGYKMKNLSCSTKYSVNTKYLPSEQLAKQWKKKQRKQIVSKQYQA